jgi:peptidoglycan/LPS O-acetylase OafA/YrhL
MGCQSGAGVSQKIAGDFGEGGSVAGYHAIPALAARVDFEVVVKPFGEVLEFVMHATVEPMTSETALPIQVKAGRLRLGYLDGLRGLAALYVVIFHVSQMCHGYATNYDGAGYNAIGGWTPGFSSQVRELLKFSHFALLGYGRFAVDVFIVLSGYCLMLPVARQRRDDLPNGFFGFVKRRAWRILPPYYIAIAFTLLMALLIPAMRTVDAAHPAYWDSCARGIFDGKTIVTHLLLIQSWGPWAIRIDGPMWSVAVEWQIYLLFPLLILPLRKYLGSLTMATVVFAGGALFYWGLRSLLLAVKPDYYTYVEFCSPWFAGEFAFGVLAASLAFSGRARETRIHQKFPWLTASVLLGLFLVFLELAGRKSWDQDTALRFFRESAWGSAWVGDLTISLAVMCLIIHLTRQVVGTHERGWLLGVLESKWAVRLGEFSYSLYLVHYPVVNACDVYFRTHFGPAATCLLAFAVSLPLAMVVSYGFHVWFERPFMTALQRTAEKQPVKPVTVMIEAPGPV